MNVPPYIKPALVGRICKISRKKAFGMLRRAKLLERDGEHRWHVNTDLLRERLPPAYARVFAHFDSHARESP